MAQASRSGQKFAQASHVNANEKRFASSLNWGLMAIHIAGLQRAFSPENSGLDNGAVTGGVGKLISPP